ncbi:MAG: hypothetical protein NVS4B2_14490 [Chloroflexota bacterium]
MQQESARAMNERGGMVIEGPQIDASSGAQAYIAYAQGAMIEFTLVPHTTQTLQWSGTGPVAREATTWSIAIDGAVTQRAAPLASQEEAYDAALLLVHEKARRDPVKEAEADRRS